VEYATALTLAGRYDQALRELERARELNPRLGRVYQGVGYVHAMKGDWLGAIEAVEADPAYPMARPTDPWLGFYYASVGRREEALRVLRNIEAHLEDRAYKWIALGIVHLGLGDEQKAMDCIEAGIEEGARSDVTITTLLYEFLKDEPRYQAILGEMGLDFSSD
jgi:tetratricopeptide (TPR) repeat protein